MKAQLIRVLVLLNVALIAVSCAYLSPVPTFDPDAPRQPLECSQIMEDALLGFPFNQLMWQEAVQWVQEAYDVQPRVDLAADEVTHYLRWDQGTRRYTIMVTADELIDGVAVSHEQNPPIVQEVLTCFGEPGYYEAFYDPTPGPTYTTLRLWYPERGLAFYGSVPSPLPAIDHRMPMRLVTYVEPNSGANNEALRSWKPWPGDLERITIDDRYKRRVENGDH